MKKSLIALAVFGAFSGAAFAADSVQLYGVVDLGVARLDNGGNAVTSLSTGVLSQSAIGLKGSEDLGGGLTAIFQVETGFCPNGGGTDQGGGAYGSTGGTGTDQYCTGGGFMGRTSMVGLSGDFGTVSAGRMFTFTDASIGAVDPTGNNLLGASGTLIPADWNNITSQTLAYTSPNLFGGLTLGAAYVFGDGLGLTTAAGSRATGGYNLNATWASGPVTAGLDYIRINGDTNGDAKVKNIMAFGAYDFGVAKVGALYARNKPDASQVALGNDETKSWMLGIGVPVGPGSIQVVYTGLKDDSQSNANASLWNLGYVYSLSKRTQLYANYARLSNKDNAAYFLNNLNNGDSPAPFSGTGFNATGFAVGISHSF